MNRVRSDVVGRLSEFRGLAKVDLGTVRRENLEGYLRDLAHCLVVLIAEPDSETIPLRGAK